MLFFTHFPSWVKDHTFPLFCTPSPSVLPSAGKCGTAKIKEKYYFFVCILFKDTFLSRLSQISQHIYVPGGQNNKTLTGAENVLSEAALGASASSTSFTGPNQLAGCADETQQKAMNVFTFTCALSP